LMVEPTQRQRIAGLLEPLYTAQGAHAELARVLEVQLEELRDAGARVGVLMRLGELYERELSEIDQAFRAYARAVEADPSDPAPRKEYARLAMHVNKLEDRAALLERVLTRTSDSRVQGEILGELSELWDISVGDVPKAIAAYTRLIATDRDNAEVVLPAARALERLHIQREDYPALAEALEKQVAFEPDIEKKKELLGTLADLNESRLGNVERAIACYVERLELDASDLVAMQALERLYESRGEHLKLIGILQKRDAVAQGEAEARQLARRIGDIYETRLNDRESAIVAYNDVLGRFGNDRETLKALERVYEATERYQDLLEAIGHELELVDDRHERAEVRFRAAELMRKRTGAAEAALDAYRAVLEDHPAHEPTIAALNEMVAAGGAMRIEAARVLVPHYEAVGDHDRLIRTLEVVAEIDDVRERLAALRRAAEVAEMGQGEPGRAFGLIARAVKAALSEHDLAQLLDDLDRMAHASLRWEAYGQLLREITPDITDEDLALTVLMRAAAVARDKQEDRALAREYYERALALRPEHHPALDALEKLHVQASDYRGLLAVLRKKTELAAEPIERTKLLLRQAELCAHKLDDVSAAIDAYEKVLEEAPSHEVFDGLEALYARADRWVDLGNMYERQMDLRVGDAVLVRYKLAELLRTHLHEPERALELFADVLERSPTHEDTTKSLESLMGEATYKARAAELLEPVYLKKGRWPELTKALEAQLEAEESVERKKDLLGRLAQLHEVQLEDLDSALETYARLFRVEPSDTHSWEALGRLSRLLARQIRVAEVYEAYLDEVGVEDDTGVKLSVIAAQLRDGFARDLPKASQLYQRALAFDPSNRAVADALEDVLVRRKASDELRTFYRSQADVASDDARRFKLLHKLAKVLEVELLDLPAAIQTYQEVLEATPNDTVAIEALDRLLSEQQRFSDLAEHIGRQIEAAVGTMREVPLKLRLAQLYENQLDDVNRAIDTYEDITRLDAQNAEARTALERLSKKPELLRKTAEILLPLYEVGGQWQKLVWLHGELASREPDAGERARLHGEIARLYEERGGSPREALASYRRALVTDPRDDHAKQEIERLASVLGDWDTLVVAYEDACEITNDNDIKASLLASIARTHDERRGDPRAAITAYEKLVQIETDDPAPFEQLESLLTMVGDWRGLVALLKRKVERAYDSVERAELWRRAGSVLDELLGDSEGAIQAYRAALEETDDDSSSLEALDGLYERSGDSRALADVLRRRAELSGSSEERLDVNVRLGRVLAGALSRPHEAIEAYTRVLDDNPNHEEAIQALGELYESQSLWSDLLDNLRRQLELAEDGTKRLALTARIGSVLDEHLNELDDAIESYRDALAIDGSHEPSIRALMRIGEQADHRTRVEEILEPILRANQSWEDLATLLSRGLSSISDPVDRQVRLSRLAEVHEQGRGDKQAAFEVLCQALVDDADDEALVREVERLAGELDAHRRAAEVFAKRAAATGDGHYARELYRRVAQIAEARLGDLPRAVDANEKALERGGEDDTVLADLERLYEATQSWNELADILERRVSQAPDDATAATMLVRLGELREQHFNDKRGALTAYRDVLEREPLDPRAVVALERLVNDPELAQDVIELLDGVYRQAGDLTRVAELYEQKLKLAEGREERVAMLTELAGLWERDIGDFTRAGEALKRAFEVDPSDYGLLDEIERVATASGRFEVLEGLAETATRGDDVSRSDRRDLWMRAAGWYRDRLNDNARAEAALKKAIEADPEHEPAYEQLSQILRGESRFGDVVSVLMTWAERETDTTMARERLREAAVLAEHNAGDVERAVQCYERILSFDAGAIDALDELIRIHESAGRLGKVALLYDRRIEAEELPHERVELRHRAAALRAGKLEETDGATRLYLQNLEDDPNDLRSLDALEKLYERSERWDELLKILERRLDVAATADERTTARVRLALISEQQLGNRARAIDELREILAESPDHAEASAALTRLYAAENRNADLVEHLEQRADRARDVNDAALELATLVQLGEVIEQKLKDSARAAQIYERVIERDAAHVGALRALARLYTAAGEHERSVDVLESLLGRVSGQELVDVAFQLATTAEDKLNAHGRAEAALRRVLGAGLQVPETRERLAKLYERRGDFASLSDLIADEVEQTSDVTQKVALLRKVAELSRVKLGDARAAASYLERASQLVPDDRTVLVPLCELYIAAGQSDAAVPVLEKIIASYAGRRVKEVAGYHHMLARAYQGMGNVDRALNELDAAYRVDLTNVGVLADLGLLAYERGDLDRAQKTFRGLLLQKLDKAGPITKADVYFYLGDISRQQGDAQKAISMLERAVAEQAGHQRAKSLLASLKT
jgi:tetratricopeptide (TPR) repeat protein